MLVFIGTMATVKKITTIGFSVLAPRLKPVGMPPENGKGILPLHLALPVGVKNLTKRAFFLNIALPPLMASPVGLALSIFQASLIVFFL